MFLDLEFQELVNCLQSLPVAGRDLNQSTAISLFVFVADFCLEFLHDLTSRWRLLVNQHRNFEVPLPASGAYPLQLSCETNLVKQTFK